MGLKKLQNQIQKHKYYFVITIILVVCMVGCSPITKMEQSAVIDTVLLENQGSIGQTFVAHYDGLSSLEIYLEPVEFGDGKLMLQLNTGPLELEEITTGSLPLDTIKSSGFYKIPFQAQKDSTQVYYYLVLEIVGNGSIKVGTAPGDSYINGSFYRDHVPQEDQLSFNLGYEPTLLSIGLFQEGLDGIGFLFVAGFLFVIPGWAILGYLYPNWKKQEWLSKIALSTGLSLAFYPLLLLWTDVLGIHIGQFYAWIPPIVGICVIIWQNRNLFSNSGIHISKENFKLPDIVLLLILGLIFFIRFWVIRDLYTPIGSDSVHHTIATQLIIDNKGLIHSWLPYLKLSTFTYHFGFHTHSALFQWITGMSTERAVLITGQILNGLAVVSLYPLARRLIQNKWSGVIVILLAGLLFPMPMYYINWGRYTQLASQIILPILVILIWDLLISPKNNVALNILTAILLAGLGLTHYRIFLIGLFFIPSYLIMNSHQVNLKMFFKRISFLALGTFLLFLPWLSNLLPSKLSAFFSSSLTIPADQVSETVKQLRNLNYLTYLPGWAWIALPVTIGWGFWKRNKPIAVISLWWFLALVFANPSLLNLPGDGLITHGAVITGFYIPSSLLIGTFLESLITKSKTYKKWLNAVVFLIVIIFAIKGTIDRNEDILQEVVQVTQTDLMAIRWIEENLPQEITILTNSTPIFSANWWYAGTDAGWWIPILANRETTTKPMNYSSEKKAEKGEFIRLNRLTQQVLDFGITDPNVLILLNEENIKYIYKGQTSDNIFGTQVSTLIDNPRLKLIFSLDKVRIYKISEINE